jgi:hypothetical protein
MFREKAKIHAAPLIPGVHAFVIDDALSNPNALIQFAKKARAAFRAIPVDNFPGVQLRMTDAFTHKIEEFFRLNLREYFEARRILETHSRLSLTTLKPAQLSPQQCLPQRSTEGLPREHIGISMSLCLFEDESLGGIGFYEPEQQPPQIAHLIQNSKTLSADDFATLHPMKRGYCSGSNEYFRLVQTIPAKFNRLIVYDGAMFHAQHITSPEKLSDDPTLGRLSLNALITCRRNSDGFATRRVVQ